MNWLNNIKEAAAQKAAEAAKYIKEQQALAKKRAEEAD